MKSTLKSDTLNNEELSKLAWSFLNSSSGQKFRSIVNVPDEIDGLCCDVSEELSEYLSSNSIENKILDLRATNHPFLINGVPHTVVLVNGRILDLTYRQFEHTSDIPHTYNISELNERGWAILREY